MSFFEGSEKKIEVVVSLKRLGLDSLLDLGKEFWAEVVQESKAQILSEIKSKECVAYLLSESSLFIWDHKFTMITCGQTTLANAFLKFCEKVKSDSIKSLIYERKNEILPQDQYSCFEEDTQVFQKIFENKGQVFHFGSKNDHFIELYEFHDKFLPPEDDTTIELLMYDVSKEAKDTFNNADKSKDKIREFLMFDHWAKDFKIDDYVFEPQGYSVNALRGAEYFTIHVTPQDDGSYISFETNILDTKAHGKILKDIIQKIQPKSYDILDFKMKNQSLIDGLALSYEQKSQQQNELNSGYMVNFCHMEKQ